MIILVVITRTILPLLYSINPFIFGWANFILDSIDGDILMHFGMEMDSYQVMDKAVDLLAYIMMFWVGRKWQIGKTVTVLFVYRTIGQLIYFYTQNSFVLFIFPNFLEPLFLIYATLIFVDKKKAYKRYKKFIVLIWVFIFVFKMWNEYNVHVGHRDLSSIYFGVNN